MPGKRVGETGICSFCGKTQDQAQQFLEGPDAYICDDCVDICVKILEDAGIRQKGPASKPEVNLEELGIKPRFNKLRFILRDNHCFYLCPYSEPFNSIYKDHVFKVLSNEGFTTERADEIFGTQPIIEDIWEGINSASIIIADVTGKNPNVMYEIGMAHTIGKPVIIITQNINDVPFDLKHYRCIIYEYTPRGCTALEERLAATVRFLRTRLT
jgi:ClpX C4-type zinc finger